MSKVYDNWERLVEAVLKREHYREIALMKSITTASSSSYSTNLEEYNWPNPHDRTRQWLDNSQLLVAPSYSSSDISIEETISSHLALQEISMYIPANKLSTTHGENPEKWKWSLYDSSSENKEEVCELLRVHWLEIKAKIDVKELPLNTNYAIFLVFKVTDSPLNLEKATAAIRFKNEIMHYRDDEGYIVHLSRERRPGEKGRFPKHRRDGWMEIKLGEYFNSRRDDDEKLVIRLRENNTDKRKRGLIVRGMEIRPTHFGTY